ncbi:GH17531 [Drosophila grimshawi]|uniref:Nucleoporin NUP35 n=1 Tax=Drosophila grimshawi TaxID=7222 RepID=B4K089_DROGR|nr:GH17531 [Drosophila grimshawi]
MNLGTPTWIVVSGYQMDCAYWVYHFFYDIGHVVKSYSATNLMYLKYLCPRDFKMALSYDNQRIGYGGDILVHVKPENPVLETRIETVIEQSDQIVDIVGELIDHQMPRSIIDIDVARTMEYNRPIVAKMTFFQWLKRKISYVFYL